MNLNNYVYIFIALIIKIFDESKLNLNIGIPLKKSILKHMWGRGGAEEL